MVTEKIELSFDIPKEQSLKKIFAKQWDDLTRRIDVTLKKNGKIFIADESHNVFLRGIKPDGTVFHIKGVPTENLGEYSFLLTEADLSSSGLIRCDVSYSYAMIEKTPLCSTNVFFIENLSSAYNPNAQQSVGNFQSIEEVVVKANEKLEDLERIISSELITNQCVVAKLLWSNNSSTFSNQSVSIPKNGKELFFEIHYFSGHVGGILSHIHPGAYSEHQISSSYYKRIITCDAMAETHAKFTISNTILIETGEEITNGWGIPRAIYAYYKDDVVSGKSAYDEAVDSGFNGTKEEWLESLKGECGEKGENGADGKDGRNGVDGKDYVLTEPDKREIAQMAVDLFPIYNGEVENL